MEIALQNPSRFGSLELSTLRRWLEQLLEELVPDADSLTVRLVTDREMRQLNRAYRGKDKPTDVLSFPGESTPEGRHVGDVVIAVPTARRQAQARAHGLPRELRVLVLHGLLHCLGYDHERDDGDMARLERRLRRRWLDREVA